MATNQDISFIVQQLERMSTKIDEISKEVQLTNIEIAKLSGMKHALNDFKVWKENVEGAVNAEDLREMKAALSKVRQQQENITQLETDVEMLQAETDKLKTFKTKAMTVGTIVALAFSTALTVLGWFLAS